MTLALSEYITEKKVGLRTRLDSEMENDRRSEHLVWKLATNYTEVIRVEASAIQS